MQRLQKHASFEAPCLFLSLELEKNVFLCHVTKCLQPILLGLRFVNETQRSLFLSVSCSVSVAGQKRRSVSLSRDLQRGMTAIRFWFSASYKVQNDPKFFTLILNVLRKD